ncbi:MAG: triose-phosphate isomerase [Granulosicoccus sp.]
MRRSLVAGNWKLHGSKHSIAELAGAVANGVADLDADVLVCPTYLHLSDVSAALAGTSVSLGAQNCAVASSGAYTGEVAAQMLGEYGCRYVIVGHSERRALFSETNEQIAGKCTAACDAGLVPILCVGETLDEREAGEVQRVIGTQLDAVLESCGVASFAAMVVAYEPVWAIGTGKTATPEQAQEVHALIRQQIANRDSTIASELRIVYGGSVKPDNAATLFAQTDIDGGLIGGASLDATSFLAICNAAA